MATTTATKKATFGTVEVVAYVDVKPTKRKTEDLWCVSGQHSFRRPRVRGVKPNHCKRHPHS